MATSFNNILICDDHPICRSGLTISLKESYLHRFTLRQAASAKSVLELAAFSAPDLFILDLGLPDMSGLQLIHTVRAAYAQSKILVVTGCEHGPTLQQVLNSGIHGIMLKTHSLDKIKEVLDSISQGEIYIDETVQNMFKCEEPIALTKREYEVLELIMKGNTNKEIAELLSCSSETIKSHRTNVLRKYGVRNTAELAAEYLEGNFKVGGRSAT